MESLHAPWRIAYIRSPKSPAGTGQIFKEIAESSDDVANYVVVRERTCFALLNRFPYTGGHLLTYPKTRSRSEWVDGGGVGRVIQADAPFQNALTEVMHPDGFNIGINVGRAAGAGIVEHVHVHVVPRWSGDSNFMPVLGSTAVLPQALSEVAAELRAALAK